MRETHHEPTAVGKPPDGAFHAPYEAARTAIEEGLRIARECGFGIYHVDLLLERARLHLVTGDAQAAESDVRTALFDGHSPPPETGLPTLLAATDPECGYAWGEALGRHLLAEALLLQAAQSLRRETFVPAQFDQLPEEVRGLIEGARRELDRCRELRARIQDPKVRETQGVREALQRGELPQYPLPSTKEPPVARDQVFISYSHKDECWVEQFRTHLKPYVRNAAISVWIDTDIQTGAQWEEEIEKALGRAKVAVLPVTPNFLASDFIAEKELPPLLDAAEKEGVAIVWVPVSASGYEATPIARYQAAWDPKRPLDSLSPAEQNRAMVEVCKKILAALKA